MKLTILLVSLFCAFAVSQLDKNSKCKTPGGKEGRCVLISDCNIIKPIIEQSRLKNATAYRILLSYQCGYDRDVLVCCDLPPTGINLATRVPKIKTPIFINDFDRSAGLPDRTICGLSSQEDDRIIGGEATTLYEFPWAAALEFIRREDNSYVGVMCGGSLINDRFVVTAAHCIQYREFKIHKVRLGEWDLRTDPDCDDVEQVNRNCADKVEIYDVLEEIVHEYYDSKYRENDIGLLKLNRAVKTSLYIRPICLPPSELPTPDLGTSMTVVGWGLTENETTSNIKLKVNVPLISNKVCQDKLGRQFISPNNYCAGGERNKDACRGDSGGPLMRTFKTEENAQEQWFLEGVVGSGQGCGSQGVPAIYARVSGYTNWIVRKLVRSRPRIEIKPSFLQFSSRDDE